MPVDDGSFSVPEPTEFESPEQFKLWATTMLAVYSEAAKRNINEAESLIAKGIGLRDESMAMLSRAEAISLALARFLDKQR